MSRNTFTSITGTCSPCVYPEGRDPLLADWRRGETGTYPAWNDPLFWQSVRSQARINTSEHQRRCEQRARKNVERKNAS